MNESASSPCIETNNVYEGCSSGPSEDCLVSIACGADPASAVSRRLFGNLPSRASAFALSSNSSSELASLPKSVYADRTKGPARHIASYDRVKT